MDVDRVGVCAGLTVAATQWVRCRCAARIEGRLVQLAATLLAGLSLAAPSPVGG
jgi:hypothetical protein